VSEFPSAAKSFDGTAASFDFSEVRKRNREIFFRVSEHSMNCMNSDHGKSIFKRPF
jgi:hypothetical protein